MKHFYSFCKPCGSDKTDQRRHLYFNPIHDHGARMAHNAIGRWTVMDPLMEKYYPVSPYVYCGNNPVSFVDPDGRDVWEIDIEGRITNRIEDETQDAFFMVEKDADGNYQRTFETDDEGNKVYNSISFEYGTVESQRSISFSPDGKTADTYDVYKVRGDENGTELFEFMSQQTGVEWSQAQTGIEGTGGSNFLTTSHQVNVENGIPLLLRDQLYHNYTIRELNHNHPGGNNSPSGTSYNSSRDREAGTWGDVGFAKSVTNFLQSKKRTTPTFKIYSPKTKSYRSFGPNSK